MLEQREFSAIIADAKGVDDRLAEVAVMLRQRNVDGLLIVGDNQGTIPSITGSAKSRASMSTAPRATLEMSSTLSMNFAGAVTVINHLVDIGRARIAHITAPSTRPRSTSGPLGVTHALDEHGLRLAGRVRYGLWSQRWARQATCAVLAKVPNVDAIACGSDQIAAAALKVVIARGERSRTMWERP